ncbi:MULTISPECIES: hypothetical protein [unclassified Acidovorax]|uniref:hypothetical protein n=1 Tax=unclassified Acidovorax TaxID=2684926 RepID=UPI001C474D1C|nr:MULTISPECIES: hypothetical protein [unclassified Acidovorax]MBV7429683.1 hypothetical protein [Acidovorax sp. sif0732]MBV7448761.1 hypothetical protein [Acidovorax sp. sif0715]
MFRSFVLLLALLGGAAFGGLLLVSLLQPTWIERGARELIRQHIEHKTGEKLQALDERFLNAQARVFLRGKEQEIDAARKALSAGLPARVAAIAAEMGIPACECRKRRQQRLELQIGTAQQMQAQLDALIRSAYMDTAEKLLRELRIFSGANALAFALLGLAAWRRPHGAVGASLVPATATLLVATLASSAVYLWGQNWLQTIVFGSYVGWAQLAYIALVYAWLCDLLFNRARISLHLCQGSLSGAVSPC